MSNSNGNQTQKIWNPDCDQFRKIAEKAGFFQDFQSLRIGMEGAGYTKARSYDEARRVFEPKLLAAMNGTGVVGPIGVGGGVGGNADEQDLSELSDKWNLSPAEMRTAALWALAHMRESNVNPANAPSRPAWKLLMYLNESPLNRDKFMTSHAPKLYGNKQDLDKDADRVEGREAVKRAIEDIQNWRARTAS